MQQCARHAEPNRRIFLVRITLARSILARTTAVFVLIALWAVMTALPGVVQAAAAFQAQAPAQGYVQPGRRVGRVINLNQAIRIAAEESGGKVLSAKSVRGPNGSLQHHVRMLVGGQRVTTLVVDQQGRLQRAR